MKSWLLLKIIYNERKLVKTMIFLWSWMIHSFSHHLQTLEWIEQIIQDSLHRHKWIRHCDEEPYGNRWGHIGIPLGRLSLCVFYYLNPKPYNVLYFRDFTIIQTVKVSFLTLSEMYKFYTLHFFSWKRLYFTKPVKGLDNLQNFTFCEV